MKHTKETSIYFSKTTKNGHRTTRKKLDDNKRYRNDSSLHMVDHIIFNEVSNNEYMIDCFSCMIRKKMYVLYYTESINYFVPDF